MLVTTICSTFLRRRTLPRRLRRQWSRLRITDRSWKAYFLRVNTFDSHAIPRQRRSPTVFLRILQTSPLTPPAISLVRFMSTSLRSLRGVRGRRAESFLRRDQLYV